MKNFIAKNFSLCLIIFGSIGVFFPIFYTLFPEITPSLGLGIALYASFLHIGKSEIKYLQKNFPQLFTLTILYQIIIPIILILISKNSLEKDLLTALAILACCSSAMANPTIAQSLKLRNTWSIGFVVLSSLIVPFTLPFILDLTLSQENKIPTLSILAFTGSMIFIPAISAYLSQKFFPKKSAIIKENSGVIGVLSISFILGMLIAPYSQFFQNNIFTNQGLIGILANTILVAILGIIGFFILHKKSINYRYTNALLFASINNGLGILIAYQFFTESIIFYAILSEIPYILIPIILAIILKKHPIKNS